jgi:hypothetical protein
MPKFVTKLSSVNSFIRSNLNILITYVFLFIVSTLQYVCFLPDFMVVSHGQ